MPAKGPLAFDQYYRQFFPAQEADAFFKAIKHKHLPVLQYLPENEVQLKKLWSSAGLSWKPLSWYPYAVSWPEEVPMGQVLPGYDHHLIYPLSASSLLPVIALSLKGTETVLDACAAPGGKALAIAAHLRKRSSLTVNDLSPKRSFRLKQVLDLYGVYDYRFYLGPAERLHWRHRQGFDKILLDAPCSSEQHVYASKKHLQQWSPNRIKTLQKRQISLIRSLVNALRPGGTLVYSTCAVTPEENELVVASVLQKTSKLSLAPISIPGFSQSQGLPLKGIDPHISQSVIRILPHKQAMDPMFIAAFTKH